MSHYGLSMAAKRRFEDPIPKPILDAINRVWPNRMVEMGCDLLEESYFHELYPKLHRKFSRIKGASLRYEREAEEQGTISRTTIPTGPASPWTTRRTPTTCSFSVPTTHCSVTKLTKRLTKRTGMWKKSFRAKSSSAVWSASLCSLHSR